MIDMLIKFRFIGIPVVLALVVGSVIMIAIGVYHVYETIVILSGHGHAAEGVPETLASKIELLEAIDSFVFAMVMIYFAFGTYFLLVASEDEERSRSLPGWLDVKSIGQLKKTLLEVIVVLVAILFLQKIVSATELDWPLLIFPASIVALAIALKLIPFEHE